MEHYVFSLITWLRIELEIIAYVANAHCYL